MATTSSDRILTLDVIRGIAVMGIFSVNVVGMAMIQSAYFYPPEFGFDGTGDKVMWALNSIFVDGCCSASPTTTCCGGATFWPTTRWSA